MRPPRCSPSRGGSAVRRLAVVPAGIAVAAAASGWLYLVRTAMPGPRMGMALPLDELSRNSSVPLLEFVLVWGAAGVVLGGVARWARLERVAAAAALGLVVGVWTYATDGAVIAVVRQIPVRDAFDAAADLRATYVAATIVAVCAAAVGGAAGRGRRAPLVVA